MIKKYIDAVDDMSKERNNIINKSVDKIINLGRVILVFVVIVEL